MRLFDPDLPIDYSMSHDLFYRERKFEWYVVDLVIFVLQRCRIEWDGRGNTVKQISTPWLLPSCIITRHSKGYSNTLRIATVEETLRKLLGSISTLPRRWDRVNGIKVDQTSQARFHRMHITKACTAAFSFDIFTSFLFLFQIAPSSSLVKYNTSCNWTSYIFDWTDKKLFWLEG